MNKHFYTVVCVSIAASLGLLNITYAANAPVNATADTAGQAAAGQAKTSNTGAIVGGIAAATAIAGSITAGVISNTKDKDNSSSNKDSSSSGDELDKQLQAVLDNYRTQYGIPAMQASVSLPSESKTRDYVSGTTQYGGTTKVASWNLFQIGSNTKAFIAAIILQLETEGKLSINDPISKYLDTTKFPWPSTWPVKWKEITIKQLLNMTSGIYDYTEDDAFVQSILNDPAQQCNNLDLINIAANHPDYFSPGQGWHYSNTDYILAGLIINVVTGNTIEQVMQERLLGPTNYNLLNTYYSDENYPADIVKRTVYGYADIDGVLQDVTSPNISWGGAAGAMLSNTNNITLWVRALFGGQVLKSQQLAEMQSLVCLSADDNCVPGQIVTKQIGGFGLGLGETNAQPYGVVWSYEGGTLGYLFLYVWIPSYDTVITVTQDVAGDPEDHLGDLVVNMLNILDNSKALSTTVQPSTKSFIFQNYGSLIN